MKNSTKNRQDGTPTKSVPSGLIIINKPNGITSHDVVSRVRRLFLTRQVGHTGTLDPMAEGVLPVLVGRATKAAEFLASEDKKYRAKIKLGITTDTEDTSGKILSTSENIPSAHEFRHAAASFVGEIEQYPPMYSALKVDGEKLVNLARRGITVKRESRKVFIYSLEIVDMSTDGSEYTLDIHCSKGTYIRTLCADIGQALGCGGAMSALLRLSSGKYDISAAHRIENLEKLDYEQRVQLLLPPQDIFSEYPAITLPAFYARLAHSGAQIYQSKINASYDIGQKVRMYDNDGFFALGEVREYKEGSAIKPIKLFSLRGFSKN